MENEIEKAIEEAFYGVIEPTENFKEAKRILDEIAEGLNSLFEKQKIDLTAKRAGDKVWVLGGCSLYGDKHLVMRANTSSDDCIFLKTGDGKNTFCENGDEAQKWVIEHFKSNTGGALTLRSLMCMSALKEKKEND